MKKIIGVLIMCLMVGMIFLVPGVRADENYDHTYTDKQGDVYSGEEGQIVSGHEEIDIIEISSLKSGDNIILKMKVVGTIVDNGSLIAGVMGPWGIWYSFNLDTNGDGVSDYGVSYCNKYCYINKKGEEFNEDISDAASGSGTNTLTVVVPLSLLNNTTTLDFETWNAAVALDARGMETGGVMAYYSDSIGIADAGGGEDGADGEGGADEESEKKEEKGFIPGFETAFLLAAVGVSIVLIKKKYW